MREVMGRQWGRRTRLPSVKYSTPISLDMVLDTKLLQEKSSDEIEKIWLEYHKEQPRVSAALTKETFQRLRTRYEECPMFVLPVFRERGYISVVFQAQGQQHLYSQKAKFDNADPADVRPDLSLTFFTDLMDSKDLVLMRSQPIERGAEVSLEDAQVLVGLNQIFYLNLDWFKSFVKPFNHNPSEFDFNKVLAVLDFSQDTEQNEFTDAQANPDESSTPANQAIRESEAHMERLLSVEDAYEYFEDIDRSDENKPQ